MSALALPYWRMATAGFRQQSRYRLAAFGGLAANATFGFLKVAMLFATLEAAGGSVAGYTAGTMSAYVWISQGMLGSVNLSGRSEMADRVKSGDVAVDFLRPMNVQLAAISGEVGRAVFALIPRGVPSLVIGGLVVGMTMPGPGLSYLIGGVSVLLGMVLSAACAYLVAVCGFWLVETRGLQSLYMAISGFAAGLFVPLGLFPVWLSVIVQATPFPSVMMYPIEILTARVDLLGSLVLVAAQLGWLALVLAVGHRMTLAGRRKLEVQGG